MCTITALTYEQTCRRRTVPLKTNFEYRLLHLLRFWLRAMVFVQPLLQTCKHRNCLEADAEERPGSEALPLVLLLQQCCYVVDVANVSIACG